VAQRRAVPVVLVLNVRTEVARAPVRSGSLPRFQDALP